MKQALLLLTITASISVFGVFTSSSQVAADLVIPSDDGLTRECIASDCVTSSNSYEQLSVFSYMINLIVELSLAALFLLLISKLSKRLILAVVVVNLISLPLLYILLHFQPNPLAFGLGELGVWLGEAVGIYLLSKKSLTFNQSVLTSAITNIATVGISLLLWLQ